MKAFETPFGYLVRLDRGEPLLPTLASFLAGRQVRGAALSAIGAVRQSVLGYFDLQRREYVRRDFPEEMELISLSGNLTWAGSEPIIHAHAVLSGPDFVAHAGHLFSTEIAVSGEVFIWTAPARVERALDESLGLKLISG